MMTPRVQRVLGMILSDAGELGPFHPDPQRLTQAPAGTEMGLTSFLAICVLMLQAGHGEATVRQPMPAIGLPASSAGPSELDRFLIDRMKEARLPGLAATVVKGGEVLWTGAYGWADVEKRVPITKDTLFQLASVSKTVTACAIMQLVEQKALDLDADINAVLPFPVRHPRHPGVPITLRQLLTHTAGIRDNWRILEGTWVKNGDFPKSLGKSMEDYFRPTGEYFKPEKNFQRWAPGAKKRYSNVGIALAAYVAEVKAGIPFETLCRKNVLQPLGMKHAGFRLAGVDKSRVAMPYRSRKNGTFEPLGHHGYLDFPAGTLRASVSGMARFLLSFIGDGAHGGVRLLKESTVHDMRRLSLPKVAPRQGLVWTFMKVGDHEILGHDGGDPGVSTLMGYRTGDGVGFVLLMNGDPRKKGFEKAIVERLFEFADGN